MENKFQIGDNVRVINDGSWWVEMEGKIINVGYRSSSGYNYIVQIDEVSKPLFFESELIKLSIKK